MNRKNESRGPRAADNFVEYKPGSYVCPQSPNGSQRLPYPVGLLMWKVSFRQRKDVKSL